MPRGDQLERQWKLIQALIASSRGKTVQELADELDCHLRSVYRDLEVLQSAGFPLCTDRVDGRNLWSVYATYKSSIPLPLDLPELMALYFSLDMLRAMHDTAFYESLESLFLKIRATLPPDSIRFLENLQRALYVDRKQYRNYGRLRQIMADINDAVMRSRSVDIIYYALKRKRRSMRRVDPYRIWFVSGAFYLVGHCHLRGEVRTFALDRIRNLAITDREFQVPADLNLDAFMSGGFGAYGGVPEKVRIRFSADVAGYIQEKTWHQSQTLERLPDGDVMFGATVAVNEELENWVLSWGAKALVLEPPQLKARLAAEAEAMAAAYRAPAR